MASAAEQRAQGGFVEDGDAEFLGLGELRAGFFAGHDVVRVLADAARDLAAGLFDQVAGFVASERGQGAGEHEGLAGDAFDGARGGGLDEVQSGGAHGLHPIAVVRVAEEREDGFGDFDADAGDDGLIRDAAFLADLGEEEVAGLGGLESIHGLEVTREILGGLHADVRDTEGVDRAPEFALLGLLEAGHHVID